MLRSKTHNVFKFRSKTHIIFLRRVCGKLSMQQSAGTALMRIRFLLRGNQNLCLEAKPTTFSNLEAKPTTFLLSCLARLCWPRKSVERAWAVLLRFGPGPSARTNKKTEDRVRSCVWLLGEGGRDASIVYFITSMVTLLHLTPPPSALIF